LIGILNYGVGNVFVLEKRFNELNLPVTLISKPADMKNISSFILPGVGSFGVAMNKFSCSGLRTALEEKVSRGAFLLGICVGLQMLFEQSEEDEKQCEGLGFIPGKIVKFRNNHDNKIILPHMGWNSFDEIKKHPLLFGINKKDRLYYLHSFHAKTDDKYTQAKTTYGEIFPSIVANGNVMGIQGHPEKSHESGIKLLKNFGELNAS